MSPEYVIAHGVVHKNSQPMNLEAVVADLNEHHEIGETVKVVTRLTTLLGKIELLTEDPAEVIKPLPNTTPDPATAAIAYALDCGDGMVFLQLWSTGEFEAIRSDWPDVPPEVFIGADPLYDGESGG